MIFLKKETEIKQAIGPTCSGQSGCGGLGGHRLDSRGRLSRSSSPGTRTRIPRWTFGGRWRGAWRGRCWTSTFWGTADTGTRTGWTNEPKDGTWAPCHGSPALVTNTMLLCLLFVIKKIIHLPGGQIKNILFPSSRSKTGFLDISKKTQDQKDSSKFSKNSSK